MTKKSLFLLSTLFVMSIASLQAQLTTVTTFHIQHPQVTEVYVEHPYEWIAKESEQWECLFEDPNEEGRMMAIHFFEDDGEIQAGCINGTFNDYIDWLTQAAPKRNYRLSSNRKTQSFLCTFIASRENEPDSYWRIAMELHNGFWFTQATISRKGAVEAETDAAAFLKNLTWSIRK